MYVESGPGRKKAGPELEELQNAVKEDAAELLKAYEKNVAPLLENKGLHHGAPDPEGHMYHAQQMLRILKAIQDPELDPFHWPKEFVLPKDMPVVFRTKDGEVVQRELHVRDFDNPKKLVEKMREILTVGGVV